MRTVTLPGGEAVPALGQGTWRMGETPSRRTDEIDALRAGVDLDMSLIDTAEMYGDGATETLVGEALHDLRDRIFLVSKVYPQNAGGRKLMQACEASLKRLRTDRLDLYLLHWRGNVPLADTVDGLEHLKREGKIRHWGVSNLDVDDLQALEAAGGHGCAVDQVLYNLDRRGPEFDLFDWLAERRIPAMAYSPVEQGRLAKAPALAAVGRRHDVSALQAALAWVLRRPEMIAIPKASSVEHVQENRRALDLVLTDQDLAELDAAYPPPRRKISLEML